VNAKATLDLADLTHLNQASLDQIMELGQRLDPADTASGVLFAGHVAAVETVLRQSYRAAALLAKRAATCQEAAQVWQTMSSFADRVLATLGLLKDRCPACGVSALYDLALDYKSAAEKRYQLNLEATLCQKMPLPEGLLPPLTSPA
jgi:hypothetical protein